MKFILIFGPQAVGKVTIGHELEKITALKLFHNHMTIELLQPLFGFSSEMWRSSTFIHEEIFKAVAKSNLEGLIFTLVWAFDQKGGWEFVENICDIFESNGGEVCFVELEASIEERLRRNTTPHRLAHKPTKRNIKSSEHNLKTTMEQHRLNSFDGEIKREKYIKIDNTHLTAEEVTHMIKRRFSLK